MATNATFKVQENTGTSTLGANNVITWSNNTVSGNSIVVVICNTSTSANSVNTVTDTQGNIYTKLFSTVSGTAGDLEFWTAKNILGGAGSVTIAFTGAGAGTTAAIAREYYGADTITLIGKRDGLATGTSNAPTSNPIITQNFRTLLLGVAMQVGITGTISAGAGWSNFTSVGAVANEVAIEDQFVSSTGSYTAVFGDNTSVAWVCGIIAINEAPHGTTTSVSSTSISSTSTSISSTSSSISTTSNSTSTSSTSTSLSITTNSTSSTSSSISSTSISSTSSSTSISSTSSSISSTSQSSTSMSSTSSSTSISSTSTSFSSTSSSISSTSSSVSSTSFSSTSSSSSTSTTTYPPPFIDYSYQDSAAVTTVQQFTGTSPSTWVCPAGVTSVLAECWGGGGGGGGATTGNTDGGAGGGGGGYANATVSVTPGTSYTVSVGLGGTAGASGSGTGGTGGNSFFNTSGTVQATGGTGGGGSNNAGTATMGAGGTGSGTITHTGGNGGGSAAADNAGGGGGGAAGSLTNGGVGQTVTTLNTGGNGGAGGIGGGIGGQGGVSGSGRNGNSAGAGGGGGAASASAGGGGGGGVVRLTYTSAGLPTTVSDDVDPDTVKNVQNVSVDDGDYFVQRGSEYMIQEFKKKWTNNTDTPTFTWKGRSTQSTLTSPILIQIFNVNSGNWETLANINTIPADTDFQVAVSQTTNVSNYYDSTNTVTFRSYQQVI